MSSIATDHYEAIRAMVVAGPDPKVMELTAMVQALEDQARKVVEAVEHVLRAHELQRNQLCEELDDDGLFDVLCWLTGTDKLWNALERVSNLTDPDLVTAPKR